MNVKQIYPTDFRTYADAVKMAYGEIEAIDINTPLIGGTPISKRYCRLFPRLASSQIQHLAVSAEDNLVKLCGSNFASMIFPLLVQTELCNAATKEEVIQVIHRLRFALDQGSWGQYTTGNPPADWSETWREGYCKILMPFTFEPIPNYLIDAVKDALNEMENQLLNPTDNQLGVQPAEFFIINIKEIAEQHYQEHLTRILAAYPKCPEGKGANMFEWGLVLAIKWFAILQDHISKIDETQYQREQYLQQVLQQKAISLETFMTLDIEKALELQNEAELSYMKSLGPKPQTKRVDAKHTKLIPWMRGEENFQALWKVLTEHVFVENMGYQEIFSSHFYLADKYSKNNRTTSAPKIRWYSSLDNLLRMLESLVASNIISAVPFGKKAGTQTRGKIYNLIENHFANSDGIDFKLDAIRKAAQRKRNPAAKIDKRFNGSVLRAIRSMQ